MTYVDVCVHTCAPLGLILTELILTSLRPGLCSICKQSKTCKLTPSLEPEKQLPASLRETCLSTSVIPMV